MKFIILVFLTFVFSGSALGQRNISLSEDKPFFEYNAAKDETVVRSAFMLFYQSEGSMTTLGEQIDAHFKFSFPGRGVIPLPTLFELRISSRGNNSWKFEKEKSRNLITEVDNEVIVTKVLERVSSDKKQFVNLTFLQYFEVLSTFLTFEELSKVVNGKKVSIKIGDDYKIKLSKYDLRKIKNFLTIAGG